MSPVQIVGGISEATTSCQVGVIAEARFDLENVHGRDVEFPLHT